MIAVQFGAVHPWSVMTSVFVVPVAAGSLWLGLLAILLGPVRWLGYAVARLFEWGLNALVAMVGALAEAPTVEMKVDAATGLWIAACVVFLYFAAGSSSGRDSWTLNSTSIAPPRESSRRGSCRPVRAKEAT